MERIEIRKQRNGTSKVVLTLPGKVYKAKRNVGLIENGVLTVFRSNNHIHRNTGNSIGFCYILLRDYGNHFDKIKIHFNDQLFVTDRDFVLRHGTFRNYQNNNLEKQIFIKIADLSQTRQMELREQDTAEALRRSRLNEVQNLQGRLF